MRGIWAPDASVTVATVAAASGTHLGERCTSEDRVAAWSSALGQPMALSQRGTSPLPVHFGPTLVEVTARAHLRCRALDDSGPGNITISSCDGLVGSGRPSAADHLN